MKKPSSIASRFLAGVLCPVNRLVNSTPIEICLLFSIQHLPSARQQFAKKRAEFRLNFPRLTKFRGDRIGSKMTTVVIAVCSETLCRYRQRISTMPSLPSLLAFARFTLDPSGSLSGQADSISAQRASQKIVCPGRSRLQPCQGSVARICPSCFSDHFRPAL